MTKLILFLLLIDFKDTVIDPRRSRTRDNYNLRDAKEDFRLWDRVHGRDVLKHLEQVSKWEPGKKERERRERAEALLAKQASTFLLFTLKPRKEKNNPVRDMVLIF